MTPVFTHSGRRRKNKNYLGDLQLTTDTNEERLERQLRCKIQLFESPPRLPNGLGSVLCADEAFPRRVLAQLRKLVQVDRGALGADGDRHQVPVPGAELLELREQLLALGAACCPLHPLLGLARGQLETGDLRLLGVPRLRGPFRSEERRVGKECRSRWSPY